MYSEKVMEQFICPQNVGDMPEADGIESVGDPKFGDALTIYVQVQFRIITNIRFLAVGSTATIASSSAITILAKGMSIDEATKLSEHDIVNFLEGLPEEKLYCAKLAVNALHGAIANYSKKRGVYSHQVDSEISPKSYVNVSTKTV